MKSVLVQNKYNDNLTSPKQQEAPNLCFVIYEWIGPKKAVWYHVWCQPITQIVIQILDYQVVV